MSEYSLTKKGLDAITKIIKRSPQYKELIKEINIDLEEADKKGMGYVKILLGKWREKMNE